MSERPLLIFPSPAVMRRDDGHGRGKPPHLPGRSLQSARLGPRFDALRQAFESERLQLQSDHQGLAPEFVLVIETRGRVEEFQRAATAVGMAWLGEIDLEDLEPDESFWIPHAKTGARTNKPLDGRLYLGMTNQAVLEQLLSLWQRYCNGEKFAWGFGKWHELFEQTKDIRRWGARDRLERSGILDEWREAADSGTVPVRLELWFRSGNDGGGQSQEASVRRAIVEAGGEVLARCRIEDIRFHALKVRIPASLAHTLLSNLGGDDENALPPLFRHHEIHYFLPVAQAVVTVPEDGEASQCELPPSENLVPVLALLDGHPMAGHRLLDGRLRVHDPDDLLSKYQAPQMRHGTAMASLIVHGELDKGGAPLLRPVYCRPILEPDPGADGREHIPETVFAEDRVHRAIVEMFEGETPTAPSVLIVNLSVGDKPFDREISPWARLIDWLAWRYKLLFCVSAGNQTDHMELGKTETQFDALSEVEKTAATLAHMGQTLGDRRLLSPAEAINALTVGAQHTDHSTVAYLSHRIDLLPNQSLPSPASRFGHGYRNAIKPEILFPGGRQLYRYVGSNGRYVMSAAPSAPGQRVAAPDHQGAGALDKNTYSRGTSNATALASRAAARLYEILDELRNTSGGERINRDTTAPLLKALLVHGASWPNHSLVSAVGNAVPVPNNRKKRAVARFIGYGIADPSRVETCTAQRATVLGCGLLNQDEAHEYEFPLPVELSTSTEWRRLIITLAWLSPANNDHRAYRKAKLCFSPPTDDLALVRQQADWQQVQVGTVQHEILEGDRARAFVDGDVLRIKVSAQGDTQQQFDESIPYGLAVTLEVREQCGLPIYERVREKIEVAIRADA